MEFGVFVVRLGYLVAALLFIMGLRRLSAPRSARGSLAWIGWGMAVAVIVTFFLPAAALPNLGLAALAIALGGGLAWMAAARTGETGLRQMLAALSGTAGGATATMAAASLAETGDQGLTVTLLAVLGGLLGAVTFSAGIVAVARFRGAGTIRFGSQNQVSALVLGLALIMGLMLMGDYPAHTAMTITFFALAFLSGALFMLPVGVSGLTVVICLVNTLNGLAVTLLGFALGYEVMIVAGTLVAAAGSVLTHLMGTAAKRPVGRLLFGPFGDSGQA